MSNLEKLAKRNELTIFEDTRGFVAVFSGITGAGEIVNNEEAHDLFGNQEDVINQALAIWGADFEDTEIDFQF